MNDQQDLRARIDDAIDYSHNFATAKPNIGRTEKEHILGLVALLREAAAQLGRVGEAVPKFTEQMVRDASGNAYEYMGDAEVVPLGLALELVAQISDGCGACKDGCADGCRLGRESPPQLPAGVPDGWALVPVKPTESMLEALGNTPWVIDGHTEGNTFIQKEYRDQRYVSDGWEAMLNAAPPPPATPQPDSAALTAQQKAPEGEPRDYCLQLLVAAGHITQELADQTRAIANSVVAKGEDHG